MRAGLIVLLLSACSYDSVAPLGPDPAVGAYQTEITTDRPEVGLIQFATHRCTAVLVTPYTVLASAGCVGAPTPGGDFGSYSPGVGSGIAGTYAIDGYRTFVEDDGSGLALAHLTTPVPSAIAVPARFAAEAPETGETLTRFGFDCVVWCYADVGPTKRKYHFEWGTDPGMCPSGVTFRDDGRIAQIDDGLLADVVEKGPALKEQILAWPAPVAAGDETGLVAWWKFDDGYVAGPSGQAATFDGADPMDRPFPLLTHRTGWTFSAWLAPEAGGVLYSEGDPEVTLSLVLREDGGLGFGARHLDGVAWSTATSTPGLIPLGEWTHVAVTLEDGGPGSGTVRFYVDGRLTDAVDGQAAMDPWTAFAALGDNVAAFNGGGAARAPYLGAMDEVRIYDRALAGNALRELNNSAARP